MLIKNIIIKFFLLLIIYRGQKLDKERFIAINVHRKYNVPNQERDKGVISRNVQSNKHKGNVKS